jgi:hypothetical protein
MSRVYKVILLPLLAIIVSLISVLLIFIVTLRTINLTNAGPYSSRARAGYAAISTIIASAATAFTISQIRCLWVPHINNQFHDNRQANKALSLNSK